MMRTQCSLKYRLYLPLLLTTKLSIASVPAQAQQYLSVVAENDIYAPRGQDRHYTNGTRIGLGLRLEQGGWLSRLDDLVSLRSQPDSRRYELAMGQNIYTPEYYMTSLPVLADRPYAGWLYSELSLITHTTGITEDLSLNIGMVGPIAQAEHVQKLMHKLVEDPEPAGWDNQLRNEPTILIRYRRSWSLPMLDNDSLQADIIPRVGFNIGNVFTDAGIAMAVRAGDYPTEQGIPLRIQPGLSGSSSYLQVRNHQFDWMLYTEIQARAVAQNIFLDGNTFVDSQSVDKRRFVRDLTAGIVLGFGQFRLPISLSFSLVWRGREFKLQDAGDSFGSVQVGMQY